MLSVEDNGQGFDFESGSARQNGRGIANMEQRAKSIAGNVRWSHSRFSSGTRVELRFPLTVAATHANLLEAVAA